jgi:uncharacterized protein DUF397
VDADLSRAVWHKSTRSDGSGGACVEVARNLPGIVAVRDSKNPHGPVLIVNRDEWASFITRLRVGQPARQR